MTRRQRGWAWLATLCGGMTLYQITGTGYLPIYGGVIGGERGLGCGRFASNTLASSIDFCFLLDCENGFFGGIVDPCGTASTADDLLVDCVNVLPPGAVTGTNNTGTGTGTGTNTTGAGTNTTGGGLVGT